MKLLVLINESAASLEGATGDEVRRRVADAFAATSADAEVRVIDPRWLGKHVQEASDGLFDAIVVGGGDNMVNTVANALAAAGRKPLGVLPLGTQGHFASDLGFPRDLAAAARAIAGASVTDTLVGELNGRLFLSYAAVGLDPIALMQLAGDESIPSPTSLIYPGSRRHDVRLSTRGRTVVAQTPCVIVSNNASQMQAFGLRAAARPERGLMNIYVARRPHPRGLVQRILNRIPGRSGPAAAHFQSMVLPEMRVDNPRQRKVIVCVDGEMLQVRPPLHFRIRESPLRLLMPTLVPSPLQGKG